MCVWGHCCEHDFGQPDVTGPRTLRTTSNARSALGDGRRFGNYSLCRATEYHAVMQFRLFSCLSTIVAAEGGCVAQHSSRMWLAEKVDGKTTCCVQEVEVPVDLCHCPFH